MRTRWIFLTITVVMIAGTVLSYWVIESKGVKDVDIVAINGIVKTIESKWGQFEPSSFNAISSQPFTIMDNNGVILYQADSGLSNTVNDAIRNRDTIVDLKHNDNIVGKLFIHNEDKEIIQQMKQQLFTVLLLTLAVLSLLSFVYILFINGKVVKPFKQLQSFAIHVARGNLDLPLKMDKNNWFGAFTESFDMMREELAAARQSEYESNRSKKELVASLSHDIKTPVSSIKAVSELMLLRAADEKTIKQLNTIYSKAEQINLLVTDMFHATLEELRELKVAVTEQSSAVLSDMIVDVNDDIHIHCEPIPECILLADTTRLQQVLDNILSNSYKYARTPITITSQIIHTHLELRIMDNGMGISDDELPLLFNKYYRGSNVAGQSGSGLGLYISQYFMHRMQGDIECHNHEDGFTVLLKIKLA